MCHPDDAVGAEKGLNNWVKTEKMNDLGGAKLVYEFLSSKKVNQR